MAIALHSIIIPLEEEEVFNRYDVLPDCNRGNPWEYKGWYIYRWTGWKGCWVRKNPQYHESFICQECNKPIENWDIMYISQSYKSLIHIECARIINMPFSNGQWLAMNARPNKRDPKYYDTVKMIYSSAPGGQGGYKRGDSFDIGPDILTYYTPLEELEEAKEDALRRMYVFIDQEVGNNANL